jgi:hypothetical protein
MTSQIGMCDCASGQYWDSGSSQCVSVLSCGYTCTQDLTYPDYGFAKHKGYITKAHTEALQAHSPCIEHRRSFANIAALLS